VSKSRLEAFSDGVLAVIITIMVLELHVPRGNDLAALAPIVPVMLGYVLSFLYVAIYWNNHHHLMHATRVVGGGVLWANLHLLFWLSLVPAVTGWVGQNPSASWPVALYGVVLLMSAVAWLVLQKAIIAKNGLDSTLARAIGRDTKGKASAVMYAMAIGLAFVRPWIAELLYSAVALMWVVPDRRIESLVGDAEGS
jgi:uncharacterized membrane protein